MYLIEWLKTVSVYFIHDWLNFPVLDSRSLISVSWAPTTHTVMWDMGHVPLGQLHPDFKPMGDKPVDTQNRDPTGPSLLYGKGLNIPRETTIHHTGVPT